MSQGNLRIKKSDLVQVISGKDKGKQGRIIEVDRKSLLVVVEGVNLVARHTRPSQKNPQGGISKKEAPLHVSKVMLVDPKTGKPTRVGKKIEEGKWVRVAKKSGSVIEEKKA